MQFRESLLLLWSGFLGQSEKMGFQKWKLLHRLQFSTHFTRESVVLNCTVAIPTTNFDSFLCFLSLPSNPWFFTVRTCSSMCRLGLVVHHQVVRGTICLRNMLFFLKLTGKSIRIEFFLQTTLFLLSLRSIVILEPKKASIDA